MKSIRPAGVVDTMEQPEQQHDVSTYRSCMDACTNRVWCSKILRYLKCNRNRIEPIRDDEPGCEYLTVGPRRTIRVLRPELSSGRFYEPPKPTDRPESLNDNFYLRWAKRPHPSGNCRCSFRQSSQSSRLSTHEEIIISQEIQRIRTSLCEAEKTGRDIEELEKSLDLSQLQALQSSRKSSCCDDALQQGEETFVGSRIVQLDDHTKKKIVQDLDRYISDLLDEILNDTIRAIARADNPFGSKQDKPPNFDTLAFAFHSSHDGKHKDGGGYVNQGFVGSASDPDTLDFHLRAGGDPAVENVDCIDSGINSVETIELQPSEQDQNLEQSLMDIIDAKLGGSSIGKSLENLGMEIDDDPPSSAESELEAPDVPPADRRAVAEAEPSSPEAPKSTAAVAVGSSSPPLASSTPPAREESRTPGPASNKNRNNNNTITAANNNNNNNVSKEPVRTAAVEARSLKSLDAIEEPQPAFGTLRLSFKESLPAKRKPPACAAAVTSKVNRTVSAIRRRIATKLRCRNDEQQQPSTNQQQQQPEDPMSKQQSTRASLKLEDYRRRFPAPSKQHPEQQPAGGGELDEVTLRNRPRKKPSIVFLHGFGSSAEAFGHQLRYFANLGYPCLAPDLLGHGMSSAPGNSSDYRFDKLLTDLEAVLHRYSLLRPGHKCVIVAHNYGCSFATALANKYSSNIHQLVLISGGGPTPLAPPLREGLAHCCLRASLAPFLFCGMNRTVLYSARGRQHPYCGVEDEERLPSHMEHVKRGMSWPDGDYVFHRRICTPTLLVHGLRDNKVSLVQECQMERTMVKAFLEAIPAAGHIPMTDCPEQLNHMIRCFIDLWKNKKW